MLVLSIAEICYYLNMQKVPPVIYNQNDYGAVDLGTSSIETIQAGGCLDCSFAMLASFFGHQENPVQMNQLFIDKGVYVETDLLPDNALTQIFPDIKYVNTLNYEPVPTDLNTIKTLLDDPTKGLILRINFGNSNYHFVFVVACDGTTLHIANPLSGVIEDFSQRYGNPITANLHVLVYTGPVPTPPSPTPPDPAVNAASGVNPTQTPLAQRFNQAITKSNNFDTVAQFFGLSNDQAIQAGAGQQVIDKIKYLQSEIEILQKQLDEAKAVPKYIVSGGVLTNFPPKPPVFADGTSPIASGAAQTVPVAGKKPLSPSLQANSPTFFEQLRGLIHALLW